MKPGMEACGFLAGARVRFATTATHKTRRRCWGADDGAVYLPNSRLSNREAEAAFPGVLSYNRNRDSRLHFQRQRERQPNRKRTRCDNSFSAPPPPRRARPAGEIKTDNTGRLVSLL